MPTRKFRELVKAMPAARQQKIAGRIRESMASMPWRSSVRLGR